MKKRLYAFLGLLLLSAVVFLIEVVLQRPLTYQMLVVPVFGPFASMKVIDRLVSSLPKSMKKGGRAIKFIVAMLAVTVVAIGYIVLMQLLQSPIFEAFIFLNVAATYVMPNLPQVSRRRVY